MPSGISYSGAAVGLLPGAVGISAQGGGDGQV
jgi:hypothetical protein